LFAKQAACIDVLSRGRLVLGVGAGWLREEFDALAANFDERGSILEEWLEIARACWTGSAGPYEGRHYRFPDAIYCRPVPVRVPPVLMAACPERRSSEPGASPTGGWRSSRSWTFRRTSWRQALR